MFTHPGANPRLPEHKNADFVLEMPENEGTEAEKRTKTSILCSKGRKWGFRRAKAHKNLNFVLKKPENEGSKPQKSTKTPILCSKSPKTGVPDPNKAQKTRFCAREERKLASGSITSEKLIVNVAFLQIIAHANVPWSCLEEGFVCAMNCRNGTPSQVAVVSGTQHLHTGQATALSPILQLRTGQAAASFGGDAEVA